MVKDIIPAAFDFIENHILDITLVILAFFGLLIYIVLNNVKFPKSHPTLQKVVVLENLENDTNGLMNQQKELMGSLENVNDIEKHAEEAEETAEAAEAAEAEDPDGSAVTFAAAKREASQPTTGPNVNLCSGSAEDNSKYCSSLATKDKCGVECCVWARKKKTQNFSCVSGNSDGATNINDYDAYYYKNKYTPANPGSPGNIQIVS